MVAKSRRARRKKRDIKVDAYGRAYIKTTFNNTIVSITDQKGGVVSWSSGGKVGFKGSRKSTPFSAQLAAEDAGKEAYNLGVRYLDVYVKGPGGGRESAVRTLQNVGFKIKSIRDITPIPHNGCRPPKRRRV